MDDKLIPEETPSGEPIRYIPEDLGKQPRPGTALCLSGGGYRAMLFHAGVTWRLYEAGKLQQIDRISSVSGGSITAGVLAMNWNRLFAETNSPESFKRFVIEPLRRLASMTTDIPAVIVGSLWFGSIGDQVAKRYKRVFGDSTLQDIPDTPRFVINATNVQSGALWRFSKPYMRDYRVGEVKSPRVPLAVAVAASSAFPPFLSPVKLRLKDSAYTAESFGDLDDPQYRTTVYLTDGGVYDNLGLETAWKSYETVLVSDAGAAFASEPLPSWDWARHTYRAMMLIDNQVRSLRRRQLLESYRTGVRSGAFWTISHDLATDFGTDGALDCPYPMTRELALTRTRLEKLTPRKQEQLINWGYGICDAAIRKHHWKDLSPPVAFPFPAAGVGD
jgi:NTE family protein